MMAALCGLGAPVEAAGSAAPNVADAVVDLGTKEGAAMLSAQWKYHPVAFVEVDHKNPGPDMKASGSPNKTMDITPKAGAADFDDSKWEAIEATTLETRRSSGRFAACWYRINVTIPEKVGHFATTGSTAVFEIVVDDYAEIWVDGKLPQVLGQSGGPLAAGWNTPNRLVIGRDLKPGQKIQLAVFAINGPMSDPPGNFIWIRSATLDFYQPLRLTSIHEVPVTIERLDPAIDSIIPSDAKLEKLADGFRFTEGPIWVPAGRGPAAFGSDGFFLFSDPNNNVIHRWTTDGDVSVYRTKSGYKGMEIGEYGQPGSNGLTLDSEGRLTICEHGNRRVTRLERNGVLTVLADNFEGKRLNSPNDLVYRSDDTLYFTDPPFGLPKFHDDPRKELPDTPVFCLYKGKLKKVSSDLTGPNGLAFSPDEKHLYVTNWDTAKKVIMRYDVQPEGELTNGVVFFDMKDGRGEEALDGLKIDVQGNLFASGPGGVWVISPEGKHLGMIIGPELPANFAFGDEDGKTLYMTARTGIYRMRLTNAGIRPH